MHAEIIEFCRTMKPFVQEYWSIRGLVVKIEKEEEEITRCVTSQAGKHLGLLYKSALCT